MLSQRQSQSNVRVFDPPGCEKGFEDARQLQCVNPSARVLDMDRQSRRCHLDVTTVQVNPKPAPPRVHDRVPDLERFQLSRSALGAC